MKRTVKPFIIIFLFVFTSHPNLFAQPAKVWKSIFGEKSFNGWNIVDSSANVIIADSSFVIHKTKNTKRHVFIRSNKKYKDFILEPDCRYRIETIGDHIKVWINGIPSTNMINTRYNEGWVAFKIHYLNGAAWNENMSAAFKNIRIISLKPEKYFRDLDIYVKEAESGKKNLLLSNK